MACWDRRIAWVPCGLAAPKRGLMDTISTIGVVLSMSGVGLIIFSKRRKVINGKGQSTTIEYPWLFAGGLLLTVLGVVAQLAVAYF